MFRREENKDVFLKRRNPDRPLKNLFVTGGCGFIGSNFIRIFMKRHPTVHVYNFDKMDYCANERSVEEVSLDPKHAPYYHLIKGDICHQDFVRHVFSSCDIDTVVHFAAQSHVDNSFGNSFSFTVNNVFGTHVLLECAREWGKIEKFIHVSTDEVYGEVSQSQQESGMLNPTNPYAATKAAVEHIVKSYHISFDLPVLITRGNNVYGPYQYPEKVIPRFFFLASRGLPLTIQGTGANTRTFIYAEDVARAFVCLVEEGIIGEVYNIGSRDEVSVMDLARRTIAAFHGPDEAAPGAIDKYIRYVEDRKFNDLRYDIESTKLQALGWRQEVTFEEGFQRTLEWYRKALAEGFWPHINEGIADGSNCSAVTMPGV